MAACLPTRLKRPPPGFDRKNERRAAGSALGAKPTFKTNDCQTLLPLTGDCRRLGTNRNRQKNSPFDILEEGFLTGFEIEQVRLEEAW